MDGYRVLVVEDDAASGHALERLLNHRGWVVTVARTVAEAMGRLDQHPHCIVLDLTLPDGDGEQVLRKVREENLPIKVAVCTGLKDSLRLSRVKDLVPSGVFTKPIDFDAVCRTIEDDDTLC